MPTPAAPDADLDRLPWKEEGGFHVAHDGPRYYMREGTGSIIAGIVFAVVLASFTGVYGVRLLLTETDLKAKAFGVLMLVVSAVFSSILVYSARRGRWLLVYDRGEPGRPGEIIYRGKRLPADRVRALSTRIAGGGSMPSRIVVAELHDGSFETLGPSGVSTWPDHWAQNAATWMGLPFRRGPG